MTRGSVVLQSVELVMQGHGTWKMLCQGLDTPLAKLGTIVDHGDGQVMAGAESRDQIANAEEIANTEEESGSMESEEVTDATTAGNTGDKTKVLKFDARTLRGMIQCSS